MTTSLDIPTLPLEGLRLIEAGAGTGKTFTLAALYVRLVLGHGGEAAFVRPLMPPEILVVTFTEAATEELRARIRMRLKEAREALLKRRTPDPVLAALLSEIPDDARERAASRLDGAARVMDDAAIFTIHGFCQRMLRRHAFDSGTLFASELVSDTGTLVTGLVEDYWRRHFYPQSAARQALLAGWWQKPRDLEAALVPLIRGGRPRALLLGERPIEAPERLEPVLASLDRRLAERSQLDERLSTLWQQEGGTIRQLLFEAIESGALKANIFRPADLESKCEALTAWLVGGEAGPPKALFDSRGRLWCAQARLDESVRKGRAAPAHEFFECLEQLGEVLSALDEARAVARVRVLAHARDHLLQAISREKRRRGVWDFDDLLNGLDDALAGPAGARLAERIRRELPVAMIDEFQDTDPVQYRIFATLYAAPRRTGALDGAGADGENEATALLMIGDPRQAIYGFRGADIATYLEARRRVEHRYSLDRNFRSTESMVAAVNRLFDTKAPFQLAEIPFDAVAAQGRDEALIEAGAPACALTFWHMADSEAVRRERYLETMARATCADILRLLDGAARGETGFRRFGETQAPLLPLRPADIAILVRTGAEALKVRERLLEEGVRSVYLSQKTSVFQSREAFQLLQLFEACARPRDDRALRAALGTRLLNDSLAAIARLEEDELAWEAMVERFEGYRRRWQVSGVLPMLRAVMRDFDVAGRLLERADGERSLTDVLHLGELAQSASALLDGEQALLRWWHQALAGRHDQGLDPQSLILRLESDDTLVRVITIHKSKGLEYPLVYLPFVCDYREVDSRAATLALDDACHGPAVVEKATAEQRECADRARLQEDLRLLYVALTRARYACRVGLAPLFKGRSAREMPSATTLARSGMGALLCQHAGVEALDVAGLSAVLEALACPGQIGVMEPPRDAPPRPRTTEAAEAPARARRFRGHIDRHWWVASYTVLVEDARPPGDSSHPAEAGALAESAPGLDLEVLEESSPVPLPPVRRLLDFPRGPRPGTFLHGLLEAIDFDRLATLSEPGSDYGETLYRLIRHRVLRSSLDPHWIGVLNDWCTRVLTAPLHPRLPGLSLDRLDGWRAELEFMLPAAGLGSRRLDAMIVSGEPLPGQRAQLAPRRLSGMLKGYIDLVVEWQGRYYVIDWKSNHLGETLDAYDQASMTAAIVAHRYDVQYVLYTLALHRHLQHRLPDYDYDRHLGGVLYLFLRGMTAEGGRGVFHRRPDRDLIERLDQALDDDRHDPSECWHGESAP